VQISEHHFHGGRAPDSPMVIEHRSGAASRRRQTKRVSTQEVAGSIPARRKPVAQVMDHGHVAGLRGTAIEGERLWKARPPIGAGQSPSK
jgi:hypothetical protein